MKRTLLILCMLLMAVCCAFGLAACDQTPGGETCQHEYADDYTCHDRECIHCGEVLPASTEHVYGEPVTVAATCTEGGYTTRTCTQCGYVETSGETDALGHDFSVLKETIKEATCMAPGEAIYGCSRCDATDTKYVQALGHTPREGTTQKVEPTCTEEGYTTYTCDRCEQTITDPDSYVDALGHTPEGAGVETPATCTTDGYTTYTCSRCHKEYPDDIVEALGHDFTVTDSETEATCAHPAYEVRTCSRCNLTEREVSAAKLSHSYDNNGYCTGCEKYVTDVFAIFVSELSDNSAYHYAEKGENCSYVIYGDVFDGGILHRLHIDIATVNALIAQGYGRITVNLVNPDGNSRAFGWQPDGTPTVVYSNNYDTTTGYGTSSEYVVVLTGDTAPNITENGLDLYVACNDIGAAGIDCFGVNFTFEKSVLDAAKPETLVGYRGSSVTYDAETKTYTFSGLDLSVQNYFNFWVSEELLSTLGTSHVKFTFGVKEGQGISFGYTDKENVKIVEGNQSMVFGVLVPSSGDLFIQTIYMSDISVAWQMQTPDGFTLKIEGTDGHVPGVATGSVDGNCQHGGYTTYICGCGQTVQGSETAAADPTAHVWGTDGKCTVCGEAVNEAFILSGYNRKDSAVLTIDADDTYGYIVHNGTNLEDGQNIAVLNINEATCNALIAQGFDTLTITLGNPDENVRGFAYNVEGDDGWPVYAEPVVVDLTGRNITNGLDIQVQYNAGAAQVSTFAINLAFSSSAQA